MRCLRLGSVLELPATVDPATTLSTQLGALRWLVTFFLIELLQALEKLCISNNDAPAAVLGHVGEPSVLIQPQSGHWRDWLLFSHHSALGKRRQHERQVIDPLKRASMVMCCMQQPLFTSSTGCAQDAVPLPRCTLSKRTVAHDQRPGLDPVQPLLVLCLSETKEQNKPSRR